MLTLTGYFLNDLKGGTLKNIKTSSLIQLMANILDSFLQFSPSFQPQDTSLFTMQADQNMVGGLVS